MDKQYRTLTNCNMRQEPAIGAAVAAVVQAGAIVHVDDTRSTDGWLPGELLEAIE